MTQSAENVTQEQYINRWESHIDELSGMAWNLGPDDRERVFEVVDELKDLAAVASENRG